MAKIRVNGEQREFSGGVDTVATLLQHLGMAGAPCAVEVNREVVPRRDHASRGLRDGDEVEVVTLVGGG